MESRRLQQYYGNMEPPLSRQSAQYRQAVRTAWTGNWPHGSADIDRSALGLLYSFVFLKLPNLVSVG